MHTTRHDVWYVCTTYQSVRYHDARTQAALTLVQSGSRCAFGDRPASVVARHLQHTQHAHTHIQHIHARARARTHTHTRPDTHTQTHTPKQASDGGVCWYAVWSLARLSEDQHAVPPRVHPTHSLAHSLTHKTRGDALPRA